jgi:hypothetical protein
VQGPEISSFSYSCLIKYRAKFAIWKHRDLESTRRELYRRYVELAFSVLRTSQSLRIFEFHSIQRICWDSNVEWATTAFLHILPNRLILRHVTRPFYEASCRTGYRYSDVDQHRWMEVHYHDIYGPSFRILICSPFIIIIIIRSRDSSVGIATGWTARFQFPAVQDFSLLYSAQTESRAHVASYPMDTGVLFSQG